MEIIEEQRSVIGTGTLLDDEVRSLARGEPAQISQTMLGDDDLHAMFWAIQMRNHRNDGGDVAMLRCGSSHKNG